MTKFSPKVGDLVYFRWEDHCSYAHPGWKSIAEIPPALTPSRCETVGFVVQKTRDYLTTVAHVTKSESDADEDGSHVATRLRKAIIQGKVIKRFK